MIHLAFVAGLVLLIIGAELLVRGTVLYVGILVLMRIMPRRTGGELAIMDLVFVLLIIGTPESKVAQRGLRGRGLLGQRLQGDNLGRGHGLAVVGARELDGEAALLASAGILRGAHARPERGQLKRDACGAELA